MTCSKYFCCYIVYNTCTMSNFCTCIIKYTYIYYLFSFQVHLKRISNETQGNQ